MGARLEMEKAVITFYLLLILSWALPAFSMEIETSNQREVLTTSEARDLVDRAWEVYHDAALGGTLASPKIQTQLEENLHKSRALLAEAYDAEERGDKNAMEKRVKQIFEITKQVIAGSQEPKK